MEDRLRKFAALVELGSFTEAARALHISQPGLSASIKKLERELKESLLVRGSQPLQLTAAGEHAYRTAKEIHVSTTNLVGKLEQLHMRKPTISIGMVDGVAQAVFSYDTVFNEIERNAHLSLIVDNSRILTDAVRRGKLTLAFVVEPTLRSAEESLQYTLVGAEPFVMVCRPDRQRSVEKAMQRGTLSPFISYDRESNTYRMVAQACGRAQLQLRPTFYSTSPAVMLQLVLAGRGTAVLPYLQVRGLIASGQLSPLRTGRSYSIKRQIVCITQRGRELPPLLIHASTEVSETLRRLQAGMLLMN